jgi:DNA processing protein
MKIKSISPDESEFLQMPDTIALKHKRLYFIGSLPPKRLPTAAVVGTRKPTHYGTETTLHLAEDLAKRGVVIVSGLAFGIDAVAHRAALSVGGITIAVLAGGLDSIHPELRHAPSSSLRAIELSAGCLMQLSSPKPPLVAAHFRPSCMPLIKIKKSSPCRVI